MVFEPVVRRIGRAVAGSSVEVGGKLLGRISNRRGRTVIQVETFIDSGPRADTSAGHLFPDGEYQERVYRVVQSFDPEISHLGSWHSHHANGLLRLSVGDVRGYLDSVNDDRYGLDHFLALLVKGIGGGVPYLSYYLFGRASNDFVEVGEGDIAVIGRHHPAEELLRGVEGLPAGEVDAALAAHSRDHRVDRGERPLDRLQSLRAADNRWLHEQGLSNLRVIRDAQSRSVVWRWALRGAENVTCRYIHPSTAPGSGDAEAVIEAHLGGTLLEQKRVVLDSRRYHVIADILDRWSAPAPTRE